MSCASIHLSIDAVIFERAVTASEAHALAGRHDVAVDELTEVMSLWRGEPFGGLDLPMLDEPAAQLAGTRARAERVLIDSALRAGRAEQLLGLLEPKVAAQPENEQAVASLARALYQVGRHDDAAAVVGRCVQLLHQSWHRTHAVAAPSRVGHRRSRSARRRCPAWPRVRVIPGRRRC